jgi:hypothetical protein
MQKRNPHWRRINKAGYVVIYRPDHPNAWKKGGILEHRWKMAEHLGRPLRKNESVHHKNRKRADNRLRNLRLMTKAQHDSLPKPRLPRVCPKCGHVFAKSGYVRVAQPI